MENKTTQATDNRRHGKTPLATWGEFGRCELAVLGTTCDQIRELAGAITRHLTGLSVAYADADHKATAEKGADDLFTTIYTDKVSWQRFDMRIPESPLLRRARFNACDLVLVNGNHFTASHQIAVIDPKKPLDSRLERLVSPTMVLLQEGVAEIPQAVAGHLRRFGDLPVLPIGDISGIAAVVLRHYERMMPPVYGLVLAGGKSERMGADKGLINYHGRPQREHLYGMIGLLCTQTFISCRPDQAGEFEGRIPLITDTYLGLGQFGAILSAFQRHPDMAWLVAASDLPLLGERSLNQLLAGRNRGKYATAFRNPENGFIEPLAAIWEPRSYPALLHFLGLGYSCPRKVLVNIDVEILEPLSPEELSNVNTPDELERVKSLLGKDGRAAG